MLAQFVQGFFLIWQDFLVALRDWFAQFWG
jgi:hypothetical protein